MTFEKEKTSIVLKTNDIIIPLNHFVETLFINVINGLVESLDKIPEDKNNIEILIKKF